MVVWILEGCTNARLFNIVEIHPLEQMINQDANQVNYVLGIIQKTEIGAILEVKQHVFYKDFVDWKVKKLIGMTMRAIIVTWQTMSAHRINNTTASNKPIIGNKILTLINNQATGNKRKAHSNKLNKNKMQS